MRALLIAAACLAASNAVGDDIYGNNFRRNFKPGQPFQTPNWNQPYQFNGPAGGKLSASPYQYNGQPPISNPFEPQSYPQNYRYYDPSTYDDYSSSSEEESVEFWPGQQNPYNNHVNSNNYDQYQYGEQQSTSAEMYGVNHNPRWGQFGNRYNTYNDDGDSFATGGNNFGNMGQRPQMFGLPGWAPRSGLRSNPQIRQNPKRPQMFGASGNWNPSQHIPENYQEENTQNDIPVALPLTTGAELDGTTESQNAVLWGNFISTDKDQPTPKGITKLRELPGGDLFTANGATPKGYTVLWALEINPQAPINTITTARAPPQIFNAIRSILHVQRLLDSGLPTREGKALLRILERLTNTMFISADAFPTNGGYMILQLLTQNPQTPYEQLLSQSQTPSVDSIINGMRSQEQLKLFDSSEQLTPMGRAIIRIVARAPGVNTTDFMTESGTPTERGKTVLQMIQNEQNTNIDSLLAESDKSHLTQQFLQSILNSGEAQLIEKYAPTEKGYKLLKLLNDQPEIPQGALLTDMSVATPKGYFMLKLLEQNVEGNIGDLYSAAEYAIAMKQALERHLDQMNGKKVLKLTDESGVLTKQGARQIGRIKANRMDEPESQFITDYGVLTHLGYAIERTLEKQPRSNIKDLITKTKFNKLKNTLQPEIMRMYPDMGNLYRTGKVEEPLYQNVLILLESYPMKLPFDYKVITVPWHPEVPDFSDFKNPECFSQGHHPGQSEEEEGPNCDDFYHAWRTYIEHLAVQKNIRGRHPAIWNAYKEIPRICVQQFEDSEEFSDESFEEVNSFILEETDEMDYSATPMEFTTEAHPYWIQSNNRPRSGLQQPDEQWTPPPRQQPPGRFRPRYTTYIEEEEEESFEITQPRYIWTPTPLPKLRIQTRGPPPTPLVEEEDMLEVSQQPPIWSSRPPRIRPIPPIIQEVTQPPISEEVTNTPGLLSTPPDKRRTTQLMDQPDEEEETLEITMPPPIWSSPPPKWQQPPQQEIIEYSDEEEMLEVTQPPAIWIPPTQTYPLQPTQRTRPRPRTQSTIPIEQTETYEEDEMLEVTQPPQPETTTHDYVEEEPQPPAQNWPKPRPRPFPSITESIEEYSYEEEEEMLEVTQQPAIWSPQQPRPRPQQRWFPPTRQPIFEYDYEEEDILKLTPPIPIWFPQPRPVTPKLESIEQYYIDDEFLETRPPLWLQQPIRPRPPLWPQQPIRPRPPLWPQQPIRPRPRQRLLPPTTQIVEEYDEEVTVSPQPLPPVTELIGESSYEEEDDEVVEVTQPTPNWSKSPFPRAMQPIVEYSYEDTPKPPRPSPPVTEQIQEYSYEEEDELVVTQPPPQRPVFIPRPIPPVTQSIEEYDYEEEETIEVTQPVEYKPLGITESPPFWQPAPPVWPLQRPIWSYQRPMWSPTPRLRPPPQQPRLQTPPPITEPIEVEEEISSEEEYEYMEMPPEPIKEWAVPQQSWSPPPQIWSPPQYKSEPWPQPWQQPQSPPRLPEPIIEDYEEEETVEVTQPPPIWPQQPPSWPRPWPQSRPPPQMPEEKEIVHTTQPPPIWSLPSFRPRPRSPLRVPMPDYQEEILETTQPPPIWAQPPQRQEPWPIYEYSEEEESLETTQPSPIWLQPPQRQQPRPIMEYPEEYEEETTQPPPIWPQPPQRQRPWPIYEYSEEEELLEVTQPPPIWSQSPQRQLPRPIMEYPEEYEKELLETTQPPPIWSQPPQRPQPWPIYEYSQEEESLEITQPPPISSQPPQRQQPRPTMVYPEEYEEELLETTQPPPIWSPPPQRQQPSPIYEYSEEEESLEITQPPPIWSQPPQRQRPRPKMEYPEEYEEELLETTQPPPIWSPPPQRQQPRPIMEYPEEDQEKILEITEPPPDLSGQPHRRTRPPQFDAEEEIIPVTQPTTTRRLQPPVRTTKPISEYPEEEYEVDEYEEEMLEITQPPPIWARPAQRPRPRPLPRPTEPIPEYYEEEETTQLPPVWSQPPPIWSQPPQKQQPWPIMEYPEEQEDELLEITQPPPTWSRPPQTQQPWPIMEYSEEEEEEEEEEELLETTQPPPSWPQPPPRPRPWWRPEPEPLAEIMETTQPPVWTPPPPIWSSPPPRPMWRPQPYQPRNVPRYEPFRPQWKAPIRHPETTSMIEPEYSEEVDEEVEEEIILPHELMQVTTPRPVQRPWMRPFRPPPEAEYDDEEDIEDSECGVDSVRDMLNRFVEAGYSLEQILTLLRNNPHLKLHMLVPHRPPPYDIEHTSSDSSSAGWGPTMQGSGRPRMQGDDADYERTKYGIDNSNEYLPYDLEGYESTLSGEYVEPQYVPGRGGYRYQPNDFQSHGVQFPAQKKGPQFNRDEFGGGQQYKPPHGRNYEINEIDEEEEEEFQGQFINRAGPYKNAGMGQPQFKGPSATNYDLHEIEEEEYDFTGQFMNRPRPYENAGMRQPQYKTPGAMNYDISEIEEDEEEELTEQFMHRPRPYKNPGMRQPQYKTPGAMNYDMHEIEEDERQFMHRPRPYENTGMRQPQYEPPRAMNYDMHENNPRQSQFNTQPQARLQGQSQFNHNPQMHLNNNAKRPNNKNLQSNQKPNFNRSKRKPPFNVKIDGTETMPGMNINYAGGGGPSNGKPRVEINERVRDAERNTIVRKSAMPKKPNPSYYREADKGRRGI